MKLKDISSPDFHEKHAINTNVLKSKLAEAEPGSGVCSKDGRIGKNKKWN